MIESIVYIISAFWLLASLAIGAVGAVILLVFIVVKLFGLAWFDITDRSSGMDSETYRKNMRQMGDAAQQGLRDGKYK